MKKLLFLALWLPLFAFTTVQPDDVADQNKTFFKALQEEDAGALENLADIEFSLVAFDGNTYDKETVITGLKGGYGSFDVAEAESADTKIVGDVALVRGTCKAKGQIQGAAFDLRAYYSAVYLKRGAVWKVVHVQFTPIR
ncbi:MAG: nuclear transport factor 2 family protein [Spirosomataceae bacterium]